MQRRDITLKKQQKTDILSQTEKKQKKKVVQSPVKNVGRRKQNRKNAARKKKEQRDNERNQEIKRDAYRKEKTNSQILKMAYLFAGLFLALIIFIGKYISVDSQEIITSPYNRRQDMFADTVVRGQIKSNDGEILAKSTQTNDGGTKRSYPFGEMYAHVIGFSEKGKSGLESTMNYNLLTSNANFIEKLYNTLTEKKNMGDSVITTLNSRLQKAAYNAIGNHKGAIVALEPSSGKVLAMVSKPAFDPNRISEIWESINSKSAKDDSVLLNRATQGLYPPGSTFKILTALEFMRENKSYDDYSYTCQGKGIFNSVTINCYNNKVHGKENLTSSFAHSCNTSFANIGTSLNMDRLNTLCNDFLFNKEIPIDLPSSKSRFVLTSQSDKSQIPQTVIGQGDTGITPLHSALITAAIANSGVMMKPYLVDHIENYEGAIVKKFTAKSYKEVISSKEASALSELMENVVKEGSASALSGQTYTAAGKTGSAEFQEGKAAHAWFTCFAPVDNPEIVVTVIMENSGAGSTYAVPAAKKVLDAYFNQ